MKTISRFSNYCITKDGHIWSKPRKGIGCSQKGKWLKPLKRGNGYLFIYLYKNKAAYPISIHQLVLETYIGKCPDGMEARHLDGNKQNNKLSNLKWDTHSENEKDKIRHGLPPANAKLTERNVKLIFGAYYNKRYTVSELAKTYNVCVQTIYGVIKKQTWKHIWKN